MHFVVRETKKNVREKSDDFVRAYRWTPWSNSDRVCRFSIKLYCPKMWLLLSSPPTLASVYFMSFTNSVQPVANFYCLHSTGSVIGPLDHVKNCLIMCSNYWSSWKSHLCFVNLTEVKIVSQEKTALIFCKTWKCELICLPGIPGVVTPISEPMISWICALNPQIKCKFV